MKNPKYYTVYILKCNDNSFYTGCTSNLKARLNRHSSGQVKSTQRILPVKLIWCCHFPDKRKAFQFEKYLKSGSGHAFRNKRLI